VSPACPARTSPAVQVGGEFAISTAEQRRQIDALKALEGCLVGLDPQAVANFEGLNIRWGGPTVMTTEGWSLRLRMRALLPLRLPSAA